MDLLIDGYNLLHVSGIFVETVGPKALEHLHTAFVEFIANALPPDDVPRTTVVFDAKGRRATARRVIRHAGLKIVYAARDELADDVIGELVQQHHSPRHLTVVSSDRQVQKAARRRKAIAIDSQSWYSELLRNRREKQAATEGPEPEKPGEVVLPEEVKNWLQEFGIARATEKTPESTPPSQSLDNVFPPGYGEDVLNESAEPPVKRRRRR